MKLYLIPTCPFVHRVLIAMRLREISQDIISPVEIDLSQPPRGMLAINPTGSVPTLEIEPENGFNESMLIMEFLDSLEASGHKLFGESPLAVAKRKMTLEQGNGQFLGPLQQLLYSQGNINTVRNALGGFAAGCEWLENQLKRSKGSFLGGTVPDAVDVAFAPFIARLQFLPEENSAQLSPLISQRTAQYFEQIATHPAVVASLPQHEVMRSAALRFTQPHRLLQEVITAPRTLLENPEEQLKIVGEPLSLWRVRHDGQGYCLSAKFLFSNHSDAVNKIRWLHDTQETTDHHTSFTLRDFSTLEITLVTHEPRWGVTQKDLALAKAIQTFFTLGKLP